jgi:hypothetical protein
MGYARSLFYTNSNNNQIKLLKKNIFGRCYKQKYMTIHCQGGQNGYL